MPARTSEQDLRFSRNSQFAGPGRGASAQYDIKKTEVSSICAQPTYVPIASRVLALTELWIARQAGVAVKKRTPDTPKA